MNFSKTHQNLKCYNSLNVSSKTSHLFELTSPDQLLEIADQLKQPFYILGEGSNTLFIDGTAPNILLPKFKGIEFEERDSYYLLKVMAGENWHELVANCVEKGIGGLENLALIPGSVGAAPVQNIGAYGVEFADFCHSVHWFNFETNEIEILAPEQCNFSYRNSIFKQELKNKGLITQVCLKLPKQWAAKLSYAGLNTLPCVVTPKQVMQKVIEIRQSKLPDPLVLPNAGSFFKNPEVSLVFFQRLVEDFGEMPNYPLPNGNVKLAAGWLIEQAGLKGYKNNGVGVHNKQALVLVNYNSDNGADIWALAQYVQQTVFEKFAIHLEPEVRLVSASGEINKDSENC